MAHIGTRGEYDASFGAGVAMRPPATFTVVFLHV